MNNAKVELSLTDYGFRWGDLLVERSCSMEKPRRIQLLTVYCPNGESIQITVSKRKSHIKKFKKERK